MDDQTYFSTIQQNSEGDLYIALPHGVLRKMGWEIGDFIEWEETVVVEDSDEDPDDEEVIGYTLINLTKEDNGRGY